VDLQKFCGSQDDDRIGRLWSVDQWTMATNGHILIRVPRIDGVEENPKAPKVVGSFVGKCLDREPAVWVKCPEVDGPQSKTCALCAGSGKNFLCPECDGSGEVSFETQFSDYGEFCCLSCRGFGKVSKVKWVRMTGLHLDDVSCTCENCGGSGKVFEHKPIDVFGVMIADFYLSLVGDLPGVEIGVFEPDHPVRFRFDGGDGLIMPRKR